MASATTESEGDLGKKCVCPRCPTYNECMKKGGELLYCLEKKSACKLEKYGCICGMCPVEKLRGFGGGYFCLSGKAASK